MEGIALIRGKFCKFGKKFNNTEQAVEAGAAFERNRGGNIPILPITFHPQQPKPIFVYFKWNVNSLTAHFILTVCTSNTKFQVYAPKRSEARVSQLL